MNALPSTRYIQLLPEATQIPSGVLEVFLPEEDDFFEEDFAEAVLEDEESGTGVAVTAAAVISEGTGVGFSCSATTGAGPAEERVKRPPRIKQKTNASRISQRLVRGKWSDDIKCLLCNCSKCFFIIQ